MTDQQIKWAKSHDWFIAVLASGEGVLVLDSWVNMNEQPDQLTGQRKLYSDSKAFTDYRSLRDWAGY